MSNEVLKSKQRAFDSKTLLSLLKRADQGDESAVLEIQKLMRKDPRIIDLIGGDPAQFAECLLIQSITGKRLAQREAIYAKLRQLRAEISGPNPSRWNAC